jgi:hypothetical protein
MVHVYVKRIFDCIRNGVTRLQIGNLDLDLVNLLSNPCCTRLVDRQSACSVSRSSISLNKRCERLGSQS